MRFVVDQFETYASLVLQTDNTPLTDEEFLALCSHYPDFRIETTAEGDIVIAHPAHPRTAQRNAYVTYRLADWTDADAKGESFDSSSGFFLTNGARRSPDAAWISKTRLAGIPDSAMWHVTPEFVIELKSTSDRVETLQSKMREWTANGVLLGWLIIPETRTVEIYRADGTVDIRADINEVSGEDPVAGFVLHLERIWTGIPG